MSAGAGLTQTQSAAVFLMLLQDQDATQILSELGPNELTRVGASMCELGDIDPKGIAQAISDFVEEAQRESLPGNNREAQVRAMLSHAIGDVKADSIMRRIQPDAQPRSIELARWLAPSVMVTLVERESPQLIAVLLLMLEAEAAAEILSLLPQKMQPQVVERIARLGSVPAMAVEMLDTLLQQRIGERFGSAALTLGGAREAANLINAASGALGHRVLPAIQQRDAKLASAIEAEMVTFEMLLELDTQMMGRLLRDIENDVLVDALKGLEDEQREPFFEAMSSRAADGVKDEIELRGRIRRSDVQEAQAQIVDIARRLSDEGEIVMGSDDGEFV